MKPSLKTKNVINLFLMGLILNACTSSSIPLNITSVKVFPEPIVGEIVTLEIEIMSSNDEPNVKFTVDTREHLGNKVHLIGGDTLWQGSLVANQPQELQVKVCVVEEGSWPVEFFVVSYLPENNGWIDGEIIHLISSLESGKLIRESAYTFSQEEAAKRPTPRPITVSPECSGISK